MDEALRREDFAYHVRSMSLSERENVTAVRGEETPCPKFSLNSFLALGTRTRTRISTDTVKFSGDDVYLFVLISLASVWSM